MSTADEELPPLNDSARRFVDAARPHERLSDARKSQLRARVMTAVAAGAGVALATGAAKAAEIGATGTGASGAGAAAAGSAASAGSSGLGAGAGAAGAGTTGIAGAAGLAGETALVGGAVKVAGLSLFTKIGLSVAVVTLGAGSFLWSRVHETSGQGTAPIATVASANPFDDDEPPSTASPAPEPTASAVAADTTVPGFPSPNAIANEPVRNPLDVVPPSGSSPSAAPSASPTSSTPADTLQEEMKLLAAAHAELSRGNPSGALLLLDEHAAKFPRGTMAPERRATRAMALCKAGRTEEGLREVTALYGPDSKSPMAQKIAHACGK